MLPESRTCTKCALVKPLDEFSRAPRGLYGRKASCKECDATRHAALHPPKPRVYKPHRHPFTGDEPKTCTRCGETKPLTEYYLSRNGTAARNSVYKSICKPCSSAQSLKWFYDNRERARTTKQRFNLERYGLTPEAYAELLAAQGGVCAICKRSERTLRQGTLMNLPVDHCHTTGRVRGLLCNRCNRAIGLFGDDATLLRKGADYLEKE